MKEDAELRQAVLGQGSWRNARRWNRVGGSLPSSLNLYYWRKPIVTGESSTYATSVLVANAMNAMGIVSCI